jgi:hypothetical protein
MGFQHPPLWKRIEKKIADAVENSASNLILVVHQYVGLTVDDRTITQLNTCNNTEKRWCLLHAITMTNDDNDDESAITVSPRVTFSQHCSRSRRRSSLQTLGTTQSTKLIRKKRHDGWCIRWIDWGVRSTIIFHHWRALFFGNVYSFVDGMCDASI